MHGKMSHPLLLLHQFRRKVLMELFLLYMCCFNLHPILQHVDVVCLSVHCREQHVMLSLDHWYEYINMFLLNIVQVTSCHFFNFDN